MSTFSQSSIGETWLKRFSDEDRPPIAMLMDAMLLVSRETFARGMHALLDELSLDAHLAPLKIGLYAEQPVKKVFGKIPAYFANSRSGRATGAGRAPIIVDPRDQEVGSEGIVAQLITSYQRMHPLTAFSHPGPNKLRKEKIRRIVIVTDFIGSGQRVFDMLESFRYVATLRSWMSYGLIDFAVVAYSGTVAGKALVRSHPLDPDVRIVTGCPTIFGSFKPKERDAIYEALGKYSPGKTPFGWRGGDALIAFAHGCPNNVPPIFHSRAKGWKPLFPGRTTEAATDEFPPTPDEHVAQKSASLLSAADARKMLTDPTQRRWLSTMLVLSAIVAGARGQDQISSRTGLPVAEISSIVGFAKIAQWLSNGGNMTELGHRELARLRRRRRRSPVLPNSAQPFYYPSQLRVL